jgi:hypothetical protein
VQALYRGLSGPSALLQPYASSTCERGLLSTTKDLQTAITFSGARKSKDFPVLCEIDGGALDFGANVTPFSQYPGGALAGSWRGFAGSAPPDSRLAFPGLASL